MIDDGRRDWGSGLLLYLGAFAVVLVGAAAGYVWGLAEALIRH